ncbi:MAG: hypothetical protein U1C73_20530, partial [Dietzia sp.]|nr:hypothetical protein [Dietzia sp.]
MSGDQWWHHEENRRDDEGEYVRRTRWRGRLADVLGRQDEYRAAVLTSQDVGRDDIPSISLWLYSGRTPAMTLTVDEARTLAYGLFAASAQVDEQRDAAIARFLEGGQTPR